MHTLSSVETSHSGKKYFIFKLNTGRETITSVWFDKGKYDFLLTVNNSKDCGATLSTVRSAGGDILVSVESPVTMHKPEFSFIRFKNSQ